jgi:glycerol-3-phosphate acyltransferase PlsY
MTAGIGAALACLTIGFVAGSLPFGLWIGRAVRGVDVREHGSRNLGATNVYRVLGPPLGLTTLALDILKGAVPVWVVGGLALANDFPGGRDWALVASGLSAVLGHVFTPFVGFRGGKGVATTVGVLLALSWPAFLAFGVVFLATLALTRYVSLASTFGAVALVAALARFAPGGWRSPQFALGLALAVVVVVRHVGNYRRLARGEERRFELRRRGTAS